MKILITGGAGFIGSALCRHIITNTRHSVINVDKLTYAANPSSLDTISDNPRYQFVNLDICERKKIAELIELHKIDGILHLAAESHVDRSISGPAEFINTNIVGTYNLLEAARSYWEKLPVGRKETFRFHHISTDEVYGELPLDDSLFTEDTAYDPSSPYSASKASSDHLVKAWYRTYGLPVVLSNCSNNYGPYQFPEKLIPLITLNAFEEQNLPVYGNGQNVRDWLYVDDHARALEIIFTNGNTGETYNVGGNCERTNLNVVRTICSTMDKIRPLNSSQSHESLITYVTDRPGHDLRYAIDASKIRSRLGWQPKESFESGLEKTVRWYLDNEAWWRPLRQARYQGQRLGLIKSA